MLTSRSNSADKIITSARKEQNEVYFYEYTEVEE
jgi:hypothetical protein